MMNHKSQKSMPNVGPTSHTESDLSMAVDFGLSKNFPVSTASTNNAAIDSLNPSQSEHSLLEDVFEFESNLDSEDQSHLADVFEFESSLEPDNESSSEVVFEFESSLESESKLSWEEVSEFESSMESDYQPNLEDQARVRAYLNFQYIQKLFGIKKVANLNKIYWSLEGD